MINIQKKFFGGNGQRTYIIKHRLGKIKSKVKRKKEKRDIKNNRREYKEKKE